jgi:hypothetical protein
MRAVAKYVGVVVALFVAYAGVTPVLLQLESLLYLVVLVPIILVPALQAIIREGFVSALLFTPLLVLVFGKIRGRSGQDRFASIIFHVDRGDIFKTHQIMGSKFCLSGGIPNTLLSYGTPDEVRERCKKVIDGVAREGGYIMDASAIIQNDASVENLRVLTDFTREYGIYSETGIQENSNVK